ncbi:hypothetical protein OTU49_016836, partial [Cherax quadricarinatus]
FLVATSKSFISVTTLKTSTDPWGTPYSVLPIFPSITAVFFQAEKVPTHLFFIFSHNFYPCFAMLFLFTISLSHSHAFFDNQFLFLLPPSPISYSSCLPSLLSTPSL